MNIEMIVQQLKDDIDIIIQALEERIHDKMRIRRLLNINEELSEDIGKLKMENDYLQLENHMLKAKIRGKDNEINDLKARIKYLKQFEPKTPEIMKQGN